MTENTDHVCEDESLPEQIGRDLGGLNTAANAVGLANHAKMLASAQRRVDDSHRWQAEAIGKVASAVPENETPPIHVGDNVNHFVIKSDPPQSTPSPQPKPNPDPKPDPDPQPPPVVPENRPSRWRDSLLMSTALAAALVSGGGLTWLLTRPVEPDAPPPAVDTDTNSTIGVLP